MAAAGGAGRGAGTQLGPARPGPAPGSSARYRPAGGPQKPQPGRNPLLTPGVGTGAAVAVRDGPAGAAPGASPRSGGRRAPRGHRQGVPGRPIPAGQPQAGSASPGLPRSHRGRARRGLRWGWGERGCPGPAVVRAPAPLPGAPPALPLRSL